jgi:hypothetical protein
MLANGRSLDYATYIAATSDSSGVSQKDNVSVDIEHFNSAARGWLEN